MVELWDSDLVKKLVDWHDAGDQADSHNIRLKQVFAEIWAIGYSKQLYELDGSIFWSTESLNARHTSVKNAS